MLLGRLLFFLLLLVSASGGLGMARHAARMANFRRRNVNKRLAERNKLAVDHHKVLKTGLLNVNGWRAERELEIEQTVASHGLDIVLLVETKLRTEDRKRIKVEGYKTFERRRSDADLDKNGGGLCISSSLI